ncbi:hypothetical protein [Sulfitobacter sp. S190]|uniref:hypothetical protein n=1 Tax=Sulfitobacter sp. S190 TaxID=2867022 RepID=UPI0021A7BC59|nr:hypothetical protein [Sulfitobacter sp. S190]UWR22806.1 hypothetical protein K3756_02050 [Sulfitobacter sp. S190]
MKGLAMVTLLAAGSACAETTLDSRQIDALLTGHTVYIQTPAGEAPVYYGADGSTGANLPNGPALRGTWSINGDGYCVDWTNGPQNSCTKISKTAQGITLTDAKTGEARGTILRIVPGNTEDI